MCNKCGNDIFCYCGQQPPLERALIVKKEHLDKILSGEKIWEMRSTSTKIRGRIGLIEAGTATIVGECELVGVHAGIAAMGKDECSGFDIMQWRHCHCVDDYKLLRKWCHPWVLQKAKRYASPTPYKHPQGAVMWVRL